MLLVNQTDQPALIGSCGAGTVIVPPLSGGKWRIQQQMRIETDMDGAEVEVPNGERIVQVSKDPVGKNYIEIDDAYRAHFERGKQRMKMKRCGVVFGEQIVDEMDRALALKRDENERLEALIAEKQAVAPVDVHDTPEFKRLAAEADQYKQRLSFANKQLEQQGKDITALQEQMRTFTGAPKSTPPRKKPVR